MAVSTINQRLEYLISYSSQLVFVCSDKIKQQSQVIESFLSEKSEQAELAIITANELWPLVTYREKIYRQLFGQSQTPDFNRPLNQLLASLNQHEGPILLSVFQAEKLPNQLVKEIWELVLQSKFANNSQQLNVLLMGQSNWAQSMKTALGAKSKDKPILLNQYQVPPTLDNQSSELDTLIQVKRQQFATRVANRQHTTYEPQSHTKKWWIIGLLAVLFMAIFSAILALLYPEKIDQWVSELAPTITPLAVNKPDTLPVQLPSLAIGEPAQPEDSAEQTPDINETSPILVATSEAQVLTSKDKLLTDWQTASANLDKQTAKILNQTGSDATKSSITKVKVTSEEVTASVPVPNQDYQVEDIVSDKQINTQPEQIAEAAVPEPTKILSQRQTAELLNNLPTEHFVIQLAAMSDIKLLRNYMQSQGLSEQLWIYQTQRYGGNWYVLLNNAHFTSIEQARNKITELSATMRENTPFVKSIQQISQEIALSGL